MNLNLNLNLLVLPPNRLKWVLALAIAIAAWLLYSPTITADFVWDARAKVLMSDFILDPSNLPDVLTGRVLTRDVLDNNRPPTSSPS